MSTDVLIIGAGINGLLGALTLVRADISVTVVDQGDFARESTWAGAGILSPLMPWDYGEEVNVLAERGRALWPGLAMTLQTSTGLDPEYWACGMLAAGDFDLEVATAWCDAHGWACSTSLPETEAKLHMGESRLWLPEVAQARNPRIAKALVAACQQAGVRLLGQSEVLGFDFQAGHVTSVRTRTGQIHADTYVVCAGAWSKPLLGKTALGVEIVPVRGQILLFKSAPGTLRHILYRQGQYLVPRMDGHILAGSTLEYAGFDKTATHEARDSLLMFALESLPALAQAELVQQWAGLRPGSPGNVPTISRHPEVDNLFLNSGHFRYGVTMAPASAELLSQLVLGQPTTLNAQPYEWRRP